MDSFSLTFEDKFSFELRDRPHDPKDQFIHRVVFTVIGEREVLFDEMYRHSLTGQCMDDFKKVLKVTTESIHTVNDNSVTRSNEVDHLFKFKTIIDVLTTML